MLKSYNELVALDVMPYCSEYPEKKGIWYLNWAMCKKLLHENGAEKVYFIPIRNDNNSSLIMTEKEFTDKNGNVNRAYETGVHIVIDDLEFDYYGPVMNGVNPVKDNSMSQQRLWNTQTRLFVKGVAVMTGLGFDLWIKEEQSDEKNSFNEDNLWAHDILKIKERVKREVSQKMDEGYTEEELAKAMEIGSEKEDLQEFFRLFNKIYNGEGMLRTIKAPKKKAK